MTKELLKLLKELERSLGLKFKDRSLLENALIHRSYASRHSLEKDNERLEFLGDSILNAAVSRMLYEMFPEKDEGQLTKIRARLVSGQSLRKWGEKLNLEKYIFMGEQAKRHSSPYKTKIVENTLEAIIGAVFLDKGFKKSFDLVYGELKDRDFYRVMDYKSLLQELSVSINESIPEYKTISHEGPSHRKIFEVEVGIEGRPMGRGRGRSKKAAQQEAAKEAYKLIQEEKAND
ncbi:MAG: ribonuclease III [Elusimicrobiota bacterium]